MGEAAGQVSGLAIGSTAKTGEPEVDAIVVEIEQTRDEMSGTVDEIGDRLDPRNIVADAKQSVRDATVGKVEATVEDMTNTANEFVSNAGQVAQETSSTLLETIRRNPIPAAMVGIGAGWLLMNRSSSTSGATWTKSGSWDRQRYDKQAYDRRLAGSWKTGEYGEESGLTDKLGQTAGSAAGQVQQTAGQFANQVGQTAEQVTGQVQGVAQDVRRQAGRMVEENPLGVAALAFAAGAAIGLTVPTSEPERQLLGQARDDLIDQAETAATGAMTDIERKARDTERKAREKERVGAS
jgi:Protein of unknown function (DUF3618)